MVIHGKQAEVHVSDALDYSTDIDGAHLKDAITGEESVTSYSGQVMDISVTDPEAGVDIENTFGGQFMVETPPDAVEAEVTMRFEDIEALEQVHGSTTYDATDGDLTTIEGAETTGERTRKAFLFYAMDGDNEVMYLLNNALFTQMGEISLDAEGFAEISGTVICKVDDRYVQTNA